MCGSALSLVFEHWVSYAVTLNIGRERFSAYSCRPTGLNRISSCGRKNYDLDPQKKICIWFQRNLSVLDNAWMLMNLWWVQSKCIICLNQTLQQSNRVLCVQLEYAALDAVVLIHIFRHLPDQGHDKFGWKSCIVSDKQYPFSATFLYCKFSISVFFEHFLCFQKFH